MYMEVNVFAAVSVYFTPIYITTMHQYWLQRKGKCISKDMLFSVYTYLPFLAICFLVIFHVHELR